MPANNEMANATGLRPLFRMAPGLELALASASPRRRQFLAEWGLPFQLVRADAREPAPMPGESPAAYTRRAAAAKAVAALRPAAQAPDAQTRTALSARCCAEASAEFCAEASSEPRAATTRRVILAADTIVAVDGDILGKPEDAAHALRMLERLNGRGHEVISAVCLLLPPDLSPASTLPGATAAHGSLADNPDIADELVDLPCCGRLRRITFSDESRVFFHHWPRSVLQAYVNTGEPHDKAGAYAIQGQGAMLVDRVEGSWSTVVGLPVTRLAHLLLENSVILPISPA